MLLVSVNNRMNKVREHKPERKAGTITCKSFSQSKRQDTLMGVNKIPINHLHMNVHNCELIRETIEN